MWARNLLFIVLVLVGISALSANLFPPSVPPRVPDFDPQPFREDSFRSIVGKVNTLLQQEWSEKNLTPAPPADELTLVRRLSLGLTGTIPSLQEIRQLQTYQGEERLQWWLTGILQDRRFADYFAERLGRSYVGTEDGPFILYRRRRFVSWLSDQVMENRPYHHLVHELIADKGLWTDKPATNFITVTIEQDKKKPNADRLAGRVSRAFLGIRLDCFQCHDDQINEPKKWKQRDFQGLAAFFGQVEHGLTGIHETSGEYTMENRKTGNREIIDPRIPELLNPELLPEGGSRRERLAQWVTNPKNPLLARATVNRVWALMFGKPLVEPVDNLPPDEKELPPVLVELAKDFADHNFDLRRLIRVIAATDAFHRDSRILPGMEMDEKQEKAHEKAFALFPMTRLRPEQVAGSLLQAASLETINAESHIITRIARYGGENEFVKRYGDTGEDEFSGGGGTIPQRLLMMNGNLVHDKTKESLFNAASRIALLAKDDRSAVESAYLSVLTRMPTPEEAEHFENRLANRETKRSQRMEDLYWALLNVTEFSWNH